jgi:quinohemoprotein ethanol dehydrogenase
MLMAFKLNGEAQIPDLQRYSQAVPMPPRLPDPSQIEAGKELWKRASCGACHGYHVSGVQYRRLDGGIPDLRYSPEIVHEQWLGVLYGARQDKGMPSFAGMLELDHARAIQEYVLYRSWDKYCKENSQLPSEQRHEYCLRGSSH